MKKSLPVFLLLLAVRPFAAISQEEKPPRFALHFQATYIYQYKPQFSAPYSGLNSITPYEEKQNSLTATLGLNVRLWKGAEVIVSPELAGGSGLSGAFGLGAASNGETFRVGNPEPTVYLARGLFSQKISLHQPDTSNPYSGDYLQFLIGKMSLGDLFDNNEYANSPRTQFMNWCLMNNGAWDYAANVRGYTNAFVAVVHCGSMDYKAAAAMLPVTANGAELNTAIGESIALNAEVAKKYKLRNGRAGNIRLLGFLNSGGFGQYSAALKRGTYRPNVVLTREQGRQKAGLGLSADQEVSNSVGVFMRAGWNDGINETWAFTEVDRTISAGAMLKGKMWKRNSDYAGIAIDVNGLSDDHRKYLAAGGLGFQLGDGTLRYANETAVEFFYNFKPLDASIWFSGDYQFIMNPGYNSDRGPVNVFSIRVHTEL